MTRIQCQMAPTMHLHELTFSTADTVTFISTFGVTKACLVTGKNASATALLFTWSVSGRTVTIKASASNSETISVLEFGGV